MNIHFNKYVSPNACVRPHYFERYIAMDVYYSYTNGVDLMILTGCKVNGRNLA